MPNERDEVRSDSPVLETHKPIHNQNHPPPQRDRQQDKESTILVDDKESKEIETGTETERDKVDTDLLVADEKSIIFVAEEIETESDKVDTDSAIRETIILVAEEIEPEGDEVDTDTVLNETTIEVEIVELEDNESGKYKGTVIKDSEPKLPFQGTIEKTKKQLRKGWL